MRAALALAAALSSTAAMSQPAPAGTVAPGTLRPYPNVNAVPRYDRPRLKTPAEQAAIRAELEALAKARTAGRPAGR